MNARRRSAAARRGAKRAAQGKRPLGTARGKIVYRKNFDAPLPKYLRKAFGIE